MKSWVLAVGLLAMSAAGAAGQSSDRDKDRDDAVHQQEQQQDSRVDEKHMSKREKKELKERRKREEKERRAQEKREKDEARRQRSRDDKDRRREAREDEKRERDKMRREAKVRDDEHRREHAEEAREEHHEFEADRRQTNHERAELNSDMARALRAQQRVSQSIYQQFRNSDVRVLLNGSNQLVLRGSAPTPSFRQRLLRLATAAAGGYTIVDQLAANAVSSAAGEATHAVIGGVASMVHGNDRGGNNGPPPDNSAPYNAAPAYANNAPPPANPGAGYSAASAEPAPGSGACVTVDTAQVALEGNATSPNDAENFRAFARQLGGRADVVDHLVLNNNQASAAAASNAAPAAPGSSIVRAGSVVCMKSDQPNEVVLTGHVGSAAELANVERAVQPLLGGARLVDQLSTGEEAAAQNVGQPSAATIPAPSNGAPSSAGAPASSSTAGEMAATNNSGIDSDAGLEQALHSIPHLSGVEAETAADGIHLSGSVDSADDHQMARNIAQQYANGRAVIDNVTVGSNAALRK